MFLPLLDQSKKNNGKGMLDMLVEVYTSDDLRLTYTITEVRRHVPKSNGFDDPLSRKTEDALAPDVRGPEGHADRAPGRRDAVQRPRPADHAAAHPKPQPARLHLVGGTGRRPSLRSSRSAAGRPRRATAASDDDRR